jgi:DNA-directed RNA polymerase sigma subunit (sigma70/sigma32)
MTQRDQFILYCRYLLSPPMSRSQIAEMLSLSNERVRQIERMVVRNLRRAWVRWGGEMKPPPLPVRQGRRYEP